MKQYKVVYMDSGDEIKVLNKMVKDGWLLVSVDGQKAYLVKEKKK